MHVLIRPRPGNFCYSKAEVDRMCEDIKRCREMGADGVVIGALTPNGDPDTEALKQMLQATGREQPQLPTESTPQLPRQLPQQPLPLSLHLVFHRAFDVCRNPLQALEGLIGLGFQTLLTSGHEQKAEEGIPLIAQLVKQAAGRIDIMAGSGVNPRNVLRIIEETGVRTVHLSATKAPDPQDPGDFFSLPPAVRRNLPPQTVLRTFPHSNEEIIREVMALVYIK
jgi:copper homeostasis protein